MIDGIVIITSTSVHPPFIFQCIHQDQHTLLQLLLASASASGVHNTRTLTVFPVPCEVKQHLLPFGWLYEDLYLNEHQRPLMNQILC